jgi:hypothetical protein
VTAGSLIFLHNAFALGAFAGELAGAAHGFGALAGFFLGRLLEMLAGLHFPEQAFALHLLLQRAQGLLDIVIADDDLYDGTSPWADRRDDPGPEFASIN